jgi:ADP-ribose pyrophosphatase
VVPITDRDSVLLCRQYRGAFDRELLEIPAGTRDVAGEPPEETARRELAEEIGVHAAEIRPLAEMLNSPGFCDEVTLLFLATGLTSVEPHRHGIEEEYIDIVEVPLAELPDMVASRRLTDAQSVLGLFLAREALAGRLPPLQPTVPRPSTGSIGGAEPLL